MVGKTMTLVIPNLIFDCNITKREAARCNVPGR